MKLNLKHYLIAGGLAISAVAAVLFRRSKTRSNLMYYPVVGRITSTFGNRINPITKASQFHNGIDIAAAEGTRILCPSDGIVKQEFSNATGGNQLVIEHDNGFTSGYAHLSKYAVKINDRVYQGNTIAYSGSTGQVTGPHLHFTLKDQKGNYLNPVDYLT